ncbi:MAG: MOSC domain-containing protein [Spirochaetota bacterium]
MAYIVALSLVDAEGGRTRTLPEVEVCPEWGLLGDKHAGPGDRQLTILASSARTAVSESEEPGLCYARFRENHLVEGLDPGELSPGDVLTVGKARLRITTATKRCYPECAIDPSQCRIKPHLAFAAVETGGVIRRGDEIRLAQYPYP